MGSTRTVRQVRCVEDAGVKADYGSCADNEGRNDREFGGAYAEGRSRAGACTAFPGKLLFFVSFPVLPIPRGKTAKSLRFCPLTVSQRCDDGHMDFSAAQYDGTTTLRLRRVLYKFLPTGTRSGVVVEHELDRGMVTVLDTEDGTFWRGRAEDVQVLA